MKYHMLYHAEEREKDTNRAVMYCCAVHTFGKYSDRAALIASSISGNVKHNNFCFLMQLIMRRLHDRGSAGHPLQKL